MTTLLKTQKKIQKAQKFVRLNIDEKLEKILIDYSKEYPLFNNTDIIRMILSKGIRSKQTRTFKEILSGRNFIDIDEEEAQFQWLIDNGLDRKSK